MAELYIGLMSGTSMDALDAVLVDLSETTPRLIASLSQGWDDEFRRELLALAHPADNELDRLAQLDVRLGRLCAAVCLQLLKQARIDASEIRAIGSHGQTIRHGASSPVPYTVQIGDPNTIAQLSGITTVADFRRRDMAVGGQGAPLVPAFHQAMFHSDERNRVILNIGGIANITILPAASSRKVSGFDTGPGNMLMDAWIQHVRQLSFDDNGNWARSGRVDSGLLHDLLDTPYFSMKPPKSCGREQYNLQWLQRRMGGAYQPQDIQATLCELTAITITNAVHEFAPDTMELYVCGGGTRNSYLLERITHHLSGCHVASTSVLGVDPQWVEALAFAWLARQTLLGLPGNLPAVTGAREAVILGGVYPATPR